MLTVMFALLPGMLYTKLIVGAGGAAGGRGLAMLEGSEGCPEPTLLVAVTVQV